MFEPGQNGFLEIATGEKQIIPRRQDLPTSFFRDGAIYITKSEVILSKNSILSEKLAYIVGDESRYVNLDTFDDWKKAEILVNKLFG